MREILKESIELLFKNILLSPYDFKQRQQKLWRGNFSMILKILLDFHEGNHSDLIQSLHILREL